MKLLLSTSSEISIMERPFKFISCVLLIATIAVAADVTIDVHELVMSPTPTIPGSEMVGLFDLYNSTNGGNWNWKTNITEFGIPWNFTADANPCLENWQGVSCVLPTPFDVYYISMLALTEFSLTGSLPASIGNLDHLTSLALGENDLTSTIPDSIGNLMMIEYLDVSQNYLTGTIPDSIGNLVNAKQVFLYDNQIGGSLPASLSQLSNLVSLQVQTNRLTGTLDRVFNSTLQTSLSYILLNQNQFSGELPDELFLGGNLTGIVAFSNCFHGTLPQSICLNTKLQTLQLSCLHCSTHCVYHITGNSFTTSNGVTGSIPPCILGLPELLVLGLSGNSFSGSIPNRATIGPALQAVDISNNVITGSIPAGLQQKGLRVFDMSNNRLTGHLLPSLNVSRAKSFAMNDNRLTGSLPAAVLDTANPINILTGNIFSCSLDHSNLPQGDSDTVRYECGSDDYNVPYIIWLVLVLCCGVVLYAVVFHRRALERYVAVSATAATMQAWYTLAMDAQQTLAVPALRHVWAVSTMLHRAAGQCALFLVVIMAPVYAILSAYYGTHQDEYAWTVSALLMAGPEPFALTIVALVVGLVVYSRNVWTLSVPAAAVLARLNPSDVSLPVPAHVTTRRVIAICSLYLLINVVIVAGANVAFVYIILYQSSVLQLAMSGFKIIWNGICTPFLARWLVYELSAARADFFTFELFVTLLNNVGIPILSVAFISPNCFYGVFASASTATYYVEGCAPGAQCSDTAPYYELDNYTYPFRYTYLCSYTYMDYYATAFIYVSLFSTFGVPIIEVALQQLHLRAHPNTRWFRLLDRILPRILKPICRDATAIPPRNVFRPYFDATQFLISQLTFMSLILTLGVVSPPLAASLAVTMVTTTTFTALKVGRCLTNAIEAQQFAYVQRVEQECVGVATPLMLSRAFWFMLSFSCFFITIFLFDILGDPVGFAGAVWVLIVFPLLPLAIYLTYATMGAVGLLPPTTIVETEPQSTNVHKDNSEDKVEQGNVEMHEVVSPIVLSVERI